MISMDLYKDLLNYPDECLDNRKIHKTLIYENGDLKTRDKKIIEQNIELITWKYAFTKEDLNIPFYVDEIREYLEVEIVEIQLRKKQKIKRIADILFRTMPHPSLLFFRYKNEVNIYAAHVKKHGSDYSIFTYEEEMIKTGWINFNQINKKTEKLMNDLKLENLNNMNFYTLYNDVYNALINYRSYILKNEKTGTFIDEKKKILKEIYEIENNIKELKTQIKKDINFNEVVELNIQINEYEKEKVELINRL